MHLFVGYQIFSYDYSQELGKVLNIEGQIISLKSVGCHYWTWYLTKYVSVEEK